MLGSLPRPAPLRPISRLVARLLRGAAQRAAVRELWTARSGLPGLRTAKTTLAAVLAFLVAERLGTGSPPVLAPLTALLVAQVTTYQTVASGLDRVASVLAGVVVAVGPASVVGLTWRCASAR